MSDESFYKYSQGQFELQSPSAATVTKLEITQRVLREGEPCATGEIVDREFIESCGHLAAAIARIDPNAWPSQYYFSISKDGKVELWRRS